MRAWNRLTASERSRLVLYERSPKYGTRTPYYPDDCVECANCGCPATSGRFCNPCMDDYLKLLALLGEKEAPHA